MRAAVWLDRGDTASLSRALRRVSDRLFRPAAEIVDQADLAARLAGKADIAAVQDQPVMRMQHELGRNDLLKPELDFERSLARRKPGAVGDAEHVGVHGHRVLAEGHV